MTQTPKSQAARQLARQQLGEIAPKLGELTDQVLFGEISERPQLSCCDVGFTLGL
jgi:hypothetical protein